MLKNILPANPKCMLEEFPLELSNQSALFLLLDLEISA